MDREKVSEKILAARTPAEIREAGRAADEWLAAHPDDLGIAMELEQLEMLRTARE